MSFWGKNRMLTVIVTAFVVAGVRVGVADGPEKKDGDLFVGAPKIVGAAVGAIWRVRDGQPTIFCSSPEDSFDPAFWTTPYEVVVDSKGRIAFLAGIHAGIGLLRCNHEGDPAEHLGIFRTGHLDNPIPVGWPDPFPNTRFTQRLGSLHVLGENGIAEDFQTKPHVVQEDAYEIITQPNESPTPDVSGFGQFQLDRYDSETGRWRMFDTLRDSPFINLPSVVAHGDQLWEVGDALRMTEIPLDLTITGKAGGEDFMLSLAIFGAKHEIKNAIADYSLWPRIDMTKQCPEPHYPVSYMTPANNGGFTPFGASSLVYDEYGGLGLVATTSYGPMPGPYLTNVTSSSLTDGYPSGYYIKGDCLPVPSVQFGSLMPWYSPSGEGNGVDVVAASPGGLVGTAFWAGKVLGIAQSDHLTTIASLWQPQGIAAYPAVVSSMGTTVYVTIHSPVSVLLTDAQGHRIGTDPGTGETVNDFGSGGFDTGVAEPRIIAIRNPAPGAFTLAAVGTGTGPYIIDVSSANFATGATDRVEVTGNATPGVEVDHNFSLAPDTTLAFANATPADTVPPVTTMSASPLANAAGWNNSDVTVTLDASDNDGGSGVKEIHVSLSGAQSGDAVTSGSSASAAVTAEGTTTVSYFAVDNAGNQEVPKTLTVRIDKTPPTLSCSATPTVLWPVDHKLVDVQTFVIVSDSVSGANGFTLLSISSSDSAPGSGRASADIFGFAVGAASTSGQLRAERSGLGTGRVYTLTYGATDAAGNSGSCTATVTVPHNR